MEINSCSRFVAPRRAFARLVLCLGFAFAAVMALAAAEEAGKRSYDIPAGNAADALKQFSEQSGRGVMANGDLVKGIRTNSVKGEHAPVDALELLLADTGLVAIPDTKSGAFSIRKETAIEAKNVNRAIAESSQSGRPDRSGRIELDEKGEPVVKLDTFEVFGRKTLNMDIQRTRDDAQPSVVFDREMIERQGAASLDDFLKANLTMNTTFQSTSQVGSASGNASSINLRGLGPNQTLILIDGHRTTSWSGGGDVQQPDLNGIPLAAVERIEILPVSAAGIYGGGATGGVVNVILKRNYSGGEMRLTYDNTFRSDSAIGRADITAGFNLGKATNVLVAGGWSDSNSLLTQDRPYAERLSQHIRSVNAAGLFGASSPLLGSTTNIRGSGGALLTLKSSGAALNSAVAFVPVGYSGPSSDGGVAFLTTAGKYNLSLAQTAQSGGGLRSLANSPRVRSFMASARHRLSDQVELFADFSTSQNDSYFTANSANSTFSLSSALSANPFNQNIQVTVPALGADQTISVLNRNVRALAGVIIKLPANWKLETDYTWGRTIFSSSTPGSLNTTAVTAAITSGALNLFRDVNSFATSFAPYMQTPALVTKTNVTLNDVTMRAGGDTFKLPSGAVVLSGLIEHREEIWGHGQRINSLSQSATAISGTEISERSATTDSAYLESRIPVFSDQHRLRFLSSLEVQLAGRYEKIKTIGANQVTITNGVPGTSVVRKTNVLESTNPSIGLKVQPTSDFFIRASFARGFLPPSVNQLVGDQSVSNIPAAVTDGIFQLKDPMRGNEALGALAFTSVGNENLKPERSESWSGGIVLTPRWIKNLRISVDWSRINKADAIGLLPNPLSQDGINAYTSFAPEAVIRAASVAGDPFSVGPITGLNVSNRNFARAIVEAYDFGLSYNVETNNVGTIAFDAQATRQVHNLTKTVPTTSFQETVGTLSGGLSWKANATLSWRYQTTTLGWNVHYYDAYWLNNAHTVVANQGAAMTPSQTYHDLFARIRLSGGGLAGKYAGILDRTEIKIGCRNIFNKTPPIDATSLTGYSLLANPRQQSYYLSVIREF